ncbi:oligosaccharide flippase family protein [Enterococcus cecorum]|uniref:oligosaccharide flippase family protein n=1 Tax=Enterococcus cecorum TaxID=44008 RepID=UPI00248F9C19|nr:oligosaccharide flippase family protein [Enterococcus cecorum]CAI3379604.1 oligosaccharide flippase family protein [Enterococcus cecorum]
MDKIYLNLEKINFSKRVNSLLYTIGMMVFSFSSVLLLLVVTRVLGKSEAGIFSIGWAICQQMLTIGLFGTRNVQVSDIDDTFLFSDFFSMKIISILMMLIGSLIYSFLLHLTVLEIKVSFLLSVLMSSEAFADVFAGYFQKNDKIGIVGLSYIIRVLMYDLLFIISLFVFHSVTLSISIAICISYLWLLVFDFTLIRRTENVFCFDLGRLKKVVSSSIAICVSAFLTNYIVNIPKNSIALYLDNTMQTYYNILAMPSFIISLFASVIIVPMYTDIAFLAYNDMKKFVKKIIKIQVLLIILTATFLVLGELLGVPVINFLYGVNINLYRLEFAVLIVSGGFSSLATFYVYIITVFSKSKFLFWVYGLVSILSTLFSNYLVQNFELFGATLIYFFSTLLISLLLFFSIISITKKNI